MKLLTLDIETRPIRAYVWSLHGEQHIALNQIDETGGVICFAAKWHGQPKVMFYSDHHDGHDAMVRAAHELVSEADAIITYNGQSFDMKHLRWEMARLGLEPPAPHKDIDLFKTVGRQFRPASRKLEFVADQLNVGNKIKHEGFGLWDACMAGDDAAWLRMKRYCCQDTRLTEQLYDRLLPWIPNHPNVNLYKRDHRNQAPDGPLDACPQCGRPGLMKRGYYYTATTRLQRWFCSPGQGGCGKYSRSTHRDDYTTRTGVG